MQHFRVTGRLALFLSIALSAAVPAALSAQAANPPPGVDGVIAAIQGSTITLTLADASQKSFTVEDGTIILDRQAIAVDQIKPGDAMGVSARRDNGALIATRINIFAPKMWDGAKKGQWVMASGEIMTNALTTEYVQAVSGHTLTMKLTDGAPATITVPDGIPVTRLVIVQPSALAVGLHVTLRTGTDKMGNVFATSISYDQPAKG